MGERELAADPGHDVAAAKAPAPTPAGGVAIVEGMLARGNRDPQAYASVVRRYPEAQAQIAQRIQQTAGNAFMQQVVAAQAGPDPDDDPNQVPPEYAALHPEVIQLLARSRTTMGVFTGEHKSRTFWEGVRAISTPDLHTLVQIQRGAMSAGLWPLISQLHHIYTYGTSWGIGFQSRGDPRGLTTNGQWGWDHPQFVVASQHGGSKHEWFRQNTGAGNPGLHLGIDIGEGHHNVHWDPTNPMERVGTGMPELAPGPFSPIPVTLHPKGWAVYSIAQTAEHIAEIKGLKPPSHNTDATKGFLAVGDLDDARNQAMPYIEMEDGAKPKTKDRARAAAAVARARAAVDAIPPLTKPARALAMQADQTSQPELARLAPQIAAAKHELVAALAVLFAHMKAEAPGTDAKGFDTVEGWAHGIWQAYPTAVALIDARKRE